jgi:hypothetical protein
MAATVGVGTVRVRRGKKMSTGKGWRLVAPGGKRGLKAALLKKLRVGGERIAIFRVF